MVVLAEMWRPLRAVAARVLWTYYRAVKGRDGAAIPAPAASPSLPKLSPGQSRRKQERGKRVRSKQICSKKRRSKRGRNGR